MSGDSGKQPKNDLTRAIREAQVEAARLREQREAREREQRALAERSLVRRIIRSVAS